MFTLTSKFASNFFASQCRSIYTQSLVTDRKRIGILGGLGPYATVKLIEHILLISKKFGAQKDSEYPNMNVVMNCDTPDRSSALLFGTESPFESLKQGLLVLENSGCDFAVIPCNTAHAWLLELEKSVSFPIFNMLDLTAQYINCHYPDKNWLLLSTTGTVKTNIFLQAFKKHHITLNQLGLESSEQARIQQAIYGTYGIKAGYNSSHHTQLIEQGIESPTSIINDVIDLNRAKGIDGVILGCTELPLAVNPELYKFPVLDPMYILAEHCVKECLNLHSNRLTSGQRFSC